MYPGFYTEKKVISIWQLLSAKKKRGKPLKIVEKTDITVYVLRDNNQIVKIVSYAEEIRDAASI